MLALNFEIGPRELPRICVYTLKLVYHSLVSLTQSLGNKNYANVA